MEFSGTRVYTVDGKMYQYNDGTRYEIEGGCLIINGKKEMQAVFPLSQVKRFEWVEPCVEKRVIQRRKKK